MKNTDEIQRAHDLILGVMQKKFPFMRFKEKDEAMMMAAGDALCWVLGIERNTAFAANLMRMDAILKTHNIVYQPNAQAKTEDEQPRPDATPTEPAAQQLPTPPAGGQPDAGKPGQKRPANAPGKPSGKGPRGVQQALQPNDDHSIASPATGSGIDPNQ